jgi:hypothetical protein
MKMWTTQAGEPISGPKKMKRMITGTVTHINRVSTFLCDPIAIFSYLFRISCSNYSSVSIFHLARVSADFGHSGLRFSECPNGYLTIFLCN